MSNKAPATTLAILASMDEATMFAYVAYRAGQGPIALAMGYVDEMEPSERLLFREIFDATFNKDGSYDKRRRRLPVDNDVAPFDPPYTVDAETASATIVNGAQA